jgi:hypothetical protein
MERPPSVQPLATYAGFNKYDSAICNFVLSKETLIHCKFTFRGAKETAQCETDVKNKAARRTYFPEAR